MVCFIKKIFNYTLLFICYGKGLLKIKELYGPLHKYQSQKPTGLASLVLHEGLLEAKIPPHHRLSLHQLLPGYSLMQSCIDVILQSILLLKN